METLVNNSVIAVFTCDPWHTPDSQELIGVATNIGHAINIINEFLDEYNCNQPKDEHAKLSEDDRNNLIGIMQTQNMENFDGEFILEDKDINTLDN